MRIQEARMLTTGQLLEFSDGRTAIVEMNSSEKGQVQLRFITASLQPQPQLELPPSVVAPPDLFAVKAREEEQSTMRPMLPSSITGSGRAFINWSDMYNVNLVEE